jgi:dCMP deaminase
VIHNPILQGLDVTAQISAQQLQFPQDAVHPALHRALGKGHAPQGTNHSNANDGSDLQHCALPIRSLNPKQTLSFTLMSNPPEMRPPKAPPHWDQRFLGQARVIAGWSKDPSTKVGAIAVRERRILATGYNGIPMHVQDDVHRLSNRDMRLKMTVHAEANLICYAARHGVCLNGASCYVWPLMTCSQCAAQLIQAGFIKIVIPNFVMPQRWQDSFETAKLMFIEAGVAVSSIPMSGPIEPALEGYEDELPDPLTLD